MCPRRENDQPVAALLALGTRMLRASPSARLDAELLLAHAAGRRRAWVHAWPEAEPAAEVRERFLELIARRAAGHPVAYLTGRAEFWSLELEVDESTLVPRPETETLVEIVLPRIGPGTTVLDLGTGSGAIAIALAHERPGARVVATDVSARALAMARRNAQRHATSVSLVRGDWLAPFGDAGVDVIVSNPPYVALADPHLAGDGVRVEPRVALVAGADGLDAIRTIAAGASRCLRRGGCVAMEHGFGQGAAVRDICAANDLHNARTYCDASGADRVTVADRP